MFNPLALMANAGRNLAGGLFDGRPGAFSHLQGGVSDLWRDGLFAGRAPGGQVPAPQGAAPQPPADPWKAMLDMSGQPQAPQVPQGNQAARVGQGVPAPGRVSALRTVSDVLFNGESPFASMDRQRKRPEQEAAQARMREAVQGMNLSPEEKVWLAMDPEGFMRNRNRVKQYGFHTAGGGDIVRTDPETGEVTVSHDYVNPNADLDRQLLERQIATEEAQAAAYAAQAGLRERQTQAGGFAPRAPGRGGSGGGNSAALAAIEAELRRRGAL